MTTTSPRTVGEIYERVRERCVRRSALFGLIQWDEVLNTEHIGYDLQIVTLTPTTRVFLNGKEITPNDT